MAKTVVILGGSFAGLKIAHILLRTTLPQVKDLKVIVVNPSTHAYFNLAAPRAIIPGLIPDSKIYAEIEPAFAKYPSGSFEFVLGTAQTLIPESKKVSLETESGTRELTYDVLVVTTGSSSIGNVPWKAYGSHKESLLVLHETQDKVKNAKSIVVGGAGVTGVETAGELGFEYGEKKDITLIAKDDVLMPGFLGPKVQGGSLKELETRKVKVVFKATVDAVTLLPSGKTELTLSNGDKMETDLYLPCVGVLPNTAFMPKNLLNDKSEIIVDEYMAVKGASDIWSCGDAAAIQANKVMFAGEQAAHLGQTLNAVLTKSPKKTPYKPTTKVMGVVLVGRQKGFGQVGGWSLPNFLIQMVKGKTFMVEKLPQVINGTM